MPKNCSDVTLKCCWRVSYNPERVFSTLQVIEMGLFTGLDCSCFRQIYCSSLLEHPSNFPVEKSKERKANLQGNSRLQVRAVHVPKLLLPEVFSWLDLVGLEGFQSEGSHGALWDELGCCREQERKNQELCWVLWVWSYCSDISKLILPGLHLAEAPNPTSLCLHGIAALLIR